MSLEILEFVRILIFSDYLARLGVGRYEADIREGLQGVRQWDAEKEKFWSWIGCLILWLSWKWLVAFVVIRRTKSLRSCG